MSILAAATSRPDPAGETDPNQVLAGAEGRRPWMAYLLLLPGVLWLGIFFLFPLAQLAAVSLQSGWPDFPGYYYRDLNVGNYVEALTSYAPHFGRSFLYAGAATLLAFLLAYPLAYAMAFKAGRWRGLMMIGVIAPFFTSFILRTFAWSQILGDESWVVEALNFLHLLPGDRLINTPLAVVAGLTYNFLPFMVLPIYASLERADPRVIEAGGDLYANGLTTFRTVTLPMSMPGVLAGTLLTFIPAAGDFVNMELLGPQKGTMVGNVINNQFLAVPGGYPIAAALSFTLMAAILVMVFLYVRRFGTEELV
ncbi:MAG: ABC transporter permease [Nocardioides sp.]|uniref:ABC transporter permease n=1 Tax=Nocardioides sp. TaxID=35761 RepID=UPI003F046A0D